MTTQNTRAAAPIPRQPLVLALLLNLLWINASEVARYFGLVMPMMREGLPGIPDAAPMSLPIFLIWGCGTRSWWSAPPALPGCTWTASAPA